MRIFIRKLLTKLLSKENKKKIKELEYKIKKSLVQKSPKLDRNQLQSIVTDKLNIKNGDHIFVHGSMDMINTDLSPLQIVELLLDVVGSTGSLSVPTFIRYSSEEWMKMDQKFDIKKTPSGMGIISERVRRNKDSKRSLHPTKSVACIGSIAEEIVREHHLDSYAFGQKSPFVKLLEYDVKVVGFGAPMSYLSMVHTIEDCFPEEYPLQINLPVLHEKVCVDVNKNDVKVGTYVHDLSVVAKANPEKFVKKYMSSTDYDIFTHYLTPFFVVDGKKLFDTLELQMKNSNTIYN